MVLWTSKRPAYGWTKVAEDRCFSHVDAAIRDAGTGKSPNMISGSYTFFQPTPVAIPK